MDAFNGGVQFVHNSSSPNPPPSATIPVPPTASSSESAGWGFVAELMGLNIDMTKFTWIAVFLCTMIYQWVHKAVESAQDLVERNVWCRVFIRNDEEIYDQWLVWMANQQFSKEARSFVVAGRHSTLEDSTPANEDDDADEEDTWARYWIHRKQMPLSFTPADGWHYFKYKGRRIFIHRCTDDRRDILGGLNETIQLCYFGRDPNVLKDLLEEARASYLARDNSKTVIYRDGGALSQQGWKRCYARDARPLETVVLDEEQKSAFVADMKDYLDTRTRRFYAERGIPYRRGYILHGPPGTGKSSLSFAAAGLFGMKIYVLSLASRTLTEDRLATLFSSLPSRCIVLLEDIDSAGINRATPSNNNKSPNPATAATSQEGKSTIEGANSDSNGISLSGLLNAIDGVASQENRILIMTTNHIEKLDPALIRPGRVDMKIEFTLANKSAMVELFARMFQADNTVNIKDDYASRVMILAQEFASKVPENTFSPAEIQGFLLTNKRRPEAALAGVEAWIQQTAEEKRKLKEAKEAAENKGPPKRVFGRW